jgi:hypothetical protein
MTFAGGLGWLAGLGGQGGGGGWAVAGRLGAAMQRFGTGEAI